MRKFLESLFGTSKGQANMQDIRVSKECRLFVSVESASNIVCYAAKGLVQDDMKRGALEYHLKTRYDQIKNSFNFIPDEVVSCWRFANIDKTKSTRLSSISCVARKQRNPSRYANTRSGKRTSWTKRHRLTKARSRTGAGFRTQDYSTIHSKEMRSD